MGDRKKSAQEIRELHLPEILISFERGDNPNTIAEQFGTSRHYVNKWLKQEGYKVKRGRGRSSFSAICRAREMNQRGWPAIEIARLLKTDEETVKAWIKRKSDPIRSTGADSISVRGMPLKNFRKNRIENPRKFVWKPPKKEVVSEKDLPYINLRKPPPPHKKGKWWSLEEEAYVLELMKTGRFTIRQVYEKSRASRRQQLRIWRRYRGKNTFPPAWPEITPEEARAMWEAKQAGKKEQADAILRATEERAVARQQRIAELEAQAIEEEQRIKQLEEKQRHLAAERALHERRLKKIEKVAKGPKRKVLPGSYEAEVLGLKPGTSLEPGKPGRKAMPKPKDFGHYADNGRFFVVSKEWADLEDATPDELAVLADFLTSKKFPARVAKSGDQPKAYFESTWPKKVEARWVAAVERGLQILERYNARVEALSSKKMFSKKIAKYLATAYDAYSNPKLSASQKKTAREQLQAAWDSLSRTDKLILIFKMGVAERDGSPTQKGLERGRAAKILLTKTATAAAKKLAEKKEKEAKRKALRQAEDDEVASILAGGMERLSLPEGEEE